MSKSRKGIICVIVCGIILVLAIISFFTLVLIDNHKEKTYKGTITEANESFELVLNISKSWTNDAGTENQTEGQQFDFTIIDNKDYNLNNWKIVIENNIEGYKLVDIDSAWNVEYEVDGTTFTIKPEKDIDLVSLSRSKNNSFGFILINNIKVEETDFTNISYIYHIMSYFIKNIS